MEHSLAGVIVQAFCAAVIDDNIATDSTVATTLHGAILLLYSSLWHFVKHIVLPAAALSRHTSARSLHAPVPCFSAHTVGLGAAIHHGSFVVADIP
ncbi:hypothetical protein ACH5RR_041355 [Cinchona calisaya]|uniref:Uncharacterized protein n=1 Tax=Cinchona calisaya TaxID=153742 RepID=A0ABD2XUM7_9GENT